MLVCTRDKRDSRGDERAAEQFSPTYSTRCRFGSAPIRVSWLVSPLARSARGRIGPAVFERGTARPGVFVSSRRRSSRSIRAASWAPARSHYRGGPPARRRRQHWPSAGACWDRRLQPSEPVVVGRLSGVGAFAMLMAPLVRGVIGIEEARSDVPRRELTTDVTCRMRAIQGKKGKRGAVRAQLRNPGLPSSSTPPSRLTPDGLTR